jgi:hypothetical protein
MKKNNIFGVYEKANFYSEDLEDVHQNLLWMSTKGSLFTASNSIEKQSPLS